MMFLPSLMAYLVSVSLSRGQGSERGREGSALLGRLQDRPGPEKGSIAGRGELPRSGPDLFRGRPVKSQKRSRGVQIHLFAARGSLAGASLLTDFFVALLDWSKGNLYDMDLRRK